MPREKGYPPCSLMYSTATFNRHKHDTKSDTFPFPWDSFIIVASDIHLSYYRGKQTPQHYLGGGSVPVWVGTLSWIESALFWMWKTHSGGFKAKQKNGAWMSHWFSLKDLHDFPWRNFSLFFRSCDLHCQGWLTFLESSSPHFHLGCCLLAYLTQYSAFSTSLSACQ